MKILYFNSNCPNYTSEPLLHGLRILFGNKVVDIPRIDALYIQMNSKFKYKTRGNGFTIYNNLTDNEELQSSRYFWEKDILEYDLYIISDIWEQWHEYIKLKDLVPSHKVVVIDNSNHRIFPIGPHTKRFPFLMFYTLKRNVYFKKNMSRVVNNINSFKSLLSNIIQSFYKPKNLFPIAFSIPKSKITIIDEQFKEKDFTKQIVDRDVFRFVNNSSFNAIGSNNHIFDDEKSFYDDIQKSRFGITGKREYWDSLRNYEYAANGCVLCYKNLHLKPNNCSPFGLNESNCIPYTNADNLFSKIRSIGPVEYAKLLKNSYEWIFQQTTDVRARWFIDKCKNAFK